MKTTRLTEMAKSLAKLIAKCDRAFAGSSLVGKAQARAEYLAFDEATRQASYPLMWGLATGRAPTAFETALTNLSPARFCQIALDVAALETNQNAAWEAWKSHVMSA